jgi:nucleotide-binding universal stress UspA family protein
MMFEHILYAAESDTEMPRSFAYVCELALTADAEVTVLRVGEINEEQLALARKQELDPNAVAEETEAQARVESQLEAFDVAAALREAGVFTSTMSRSGRIGEEVLKAADEIGADLIVIGSAPRSALKALITGNVTDEIVRRSSIPVLVVPRREEPPAQEEGS